MIKYNTNLGYYFINHNNVNNKIYNFDKIQLLHSRNLLKKCINKSFINVLPFIERIEPFSSNHYSLSFIKAIEEKHNIEIKENILILRVISLEIERIFCNINSLKNIFLITSDFILANTCTEIIESIHNYYETVFGHRVFHNYNTIGGFKHNFTIGNFERSINLSKLLNKKINFLFDIALDAPSVKTQLCTLACIPKFNHEDVRLSNPYFYYKDDTIIQILKNDYLLKAYHNDIKTNSAYNRFINLIDETKKSLSILKYLYKSNTTFNMHELKDYNLNKNTVYTSLIQTPRGVLKINFKTGEDKLIKSLTINDPSTQIFNKIKIHLHNVLLDDINLAINSFYISFLEIVK